MRKIAFLSCVVLMGVVFLSSCSKDKKLPDVPKAPAFNVAGLPEEGYSYEAKSYVLDLNPENIADDDIVTVSVNPATESWVQPDLAAIKKNHQQLKFALEAFNLEDTVRMADLILKVNSKAVDTITIKQSGIPPLLGFSIHTTADSATINVKVQDTKIQYYVKNYKTKDLNGKLGDATKDLAFMQKELKRVKTANEGDKQFGFGTLFAGFNYTVLAFEVNMVDGKLTAKEGARIFRKDYQTATFADPVDNFDVNVTKSEEFGFLFTVTPKSGVSKYIWKLYNANEEKNNFQYVPEWGNGSQLVYDRAAQYAQSALNNYSLTSALSGAKDVNTQTELGKKTPGTEYFLYVYGVDERGHVATHVKRVTLKTKALESTTTELKDFRVDIKAVGNPIPGAEGTLFQQFELTPSNVDTEYICYSTSEADWNEHGGDEGYHDFVEDVYRRNYQVGISAFYPPQKNFRITQLQVSTAENYVIVAYAIDKNSPSKRITPVSKIVFKASGTHQ